MALPAGEEVHSEVFDYYVHKARVPPNISLLHANQGSIRHCCNPMRIKLGQVSSSFQLRFAESQFGSWSIISPFPGDVKDIMRMVGRVYVEYGWTWNPKEDFDDLIQFESTYHQEGKSSFWIMRENGNAMGCVGVVRLVFSLSCTSRFISTSFMSSPSLTS